MKCDFCNSDKVVWEYPAKSFVIMGSLKYEPGGSVPERNDYVSDGSFMACEECSGLIESGKHEELFKRAVNRYVEEHPGDSREIIEVFIGLLQVKFRENRIGKRKERG